MPFTGNEDKGNPGLCRADIFLLPSHRACGINQLKSMRWLRAVVRKVGGLNDTVDNYDRKRQTKAPALLKALIRYLYTDR